MEKKSIFGAFLVFASKQESATSFKFRLTPDRVQERWVDVDMTMIPANVKTPDNPSGKISWDDVQIDTGDDDSTTRLFGWWPDNGFIGMAFLSSAFMASNKLELPPPLPPSLINLAKAYEFQAVIYAPDSSVRPRRRYYGFHARITKARKNERDHSLGLVAVYHAGTSQDPNEEPASTFWVDFNDPHAPYDFQASSIDVTRKAEWEGSLFIDRQVATIKDLRRTLPDTVLIVPKGHNPVVHLVDVRSFSPMPS